MGKRPRGAASSGPSTAKCFLGGLSQLTDSDKLVKYFETKYAPYKVEMCEAVWKSNFRRPTPSTRCCFRSYVCAMAWQFHAIGATLSP